MIIFNYNYFKSSGKLGYLLIICLVTLCFKGVTLAMPQHLDFVCECFLSTIIPIIRADKPLDSLKLKLHAHETLTDILVQIVQHL